MNEAAFKEVRRLQYLDAMNVLSYIPHRVLPGAKPSELCEWPEGLPVFDEKSIHAKSINTSKNKTPPIKNTDAASAGIDDKKIFAQLQKELGSNTLSETENRRADASAQPENQKSVSEAPAFSVAAVQFQLAIFQPNKELLVLVPAQHMEKVHGQLLKNILFSLGIKNIELVPIDNFRWPPQMAQASLGGQRIKSDFDSAQETLHAVLEGYQLKRDIQQVLLFENTLGARLLPNKNLAKMEVQVLPSLKSMLDDAENKKICWQLIRHLKK